MVSGRLVLISAFPLHNHSTGVYRKAHACLKPLPALVAQCEEWHYCASRSFLTIKGRAEITANLVGRVLNAFIEPLSWKSIVCPLSSPLSDHLS